MAKEQSVEPMVAQMVNGWLKSYGLDVKLEQESLNSEIDSALNEYFSKSGGNGGNRPDAKLLIQSKSLKYYPVLIEYKGYKDKLVKLDANGQVENRNAKEYLFKNINSYAVNGAVHYANALLHYTKYTDIISIGVTGYLDDYNVLNYSIGVYYVSKNNFGVGQKVDDYTDLSFLKKENFDGFVEKINSLQLSQKEIEKIREKREGEINASLVKLNNDIYENEKGLSEQDRVYLVAASIIASLGVEGKVAPLDKSDLKSSTESGNTDGEIIIRKIQSFLKEKNLPSAKKEMIVRTLQNTLTTENINKVESGESQLKRVFSKIIDDLGIYYKIGLTTDFTGRLFNEMYSWLGFSQDKLNDVVLTPSYIATLLVKLARVDMNSYVWDFATGSAGLLVAAMNEMLVDAKNKIKSPDELYLKAASIKANQLLGIEILPSVYMLAILNMILMGDGSSNIINQNSLTQFDGKYGYGKTDEKFPATAFVLNPPYSAPGNGMIFVQRALSMMNKGYAAIIIQGSAGSGKATSYNKEILKTNTLLASIKMPSDLFVGKSNVQTYIYVFRVGEGHNNDDVVKFIDFTNDGYTRTNRRKSNSNLRDTDNAKQRYEEVVNLVRFGKSKLSLLNNKEYYEGHINVEKGDDWNQTAPVDTRPSFEDLNQTIKNSLTSYMSQYIKQSSIDSSLYSDRLLSANWEEIELSKLFKIESTKSFNADSLVEGNEYDYVTRTSTNEGVLRKTGFVNAENLNDANIWSLGLLQMDFFYRKTQWYAGQFVRKVSPKIQIPAKAIPFITTILNHQKPVLLSVSVHQVDDTFNSLKVKFPVKDEQLDFEFMSSYITEIESLYIEKITDFLTKQSQTEKDCH